MPWKLYCFFQEGFGGLNRRVAIGVGAEDNDEEDTPLYSPEPTQDDPGPNTPPQSFPSLCVWFRLLDQLSYLGIFPPLPPLSIQTL